MLGVLLETLQTKFSRNYNVITGVDGHLLIPLAGSLIARILKNFAIDSEPPPQVLSVIELEEVILKVQP